MKNQTIGNPAVGENFFDRPCIIKELWDAVDANSHILIAAPRRVGKTSILRKMQSEPKEGYGVIYITTEAADSEHEFWKKLFKGLTSDDNLNLLQRSIPKIALLLESITKNIKNIGPNGVDFCDGVPTDHATAFESIITKLNLDKKIVIMIDEFPQTVENIRLAKGDNSARLFLSANRALRQNPHLTDKVTFIYTGSIGLESVAAQLNGTKFINDLHCIKISPFTTKEAMQFVDELMVIRDLKLDESTKKYLIEKIEWLIPFYLQLIIKEIEISIETVVNTAAIDQAINRALDNRNHFEHWHTRLRSAFKNPEYLYAKDILNYLSEHNAIESSDIANLAAKREIVDEKEIIHTLVYDGYINNNDNVKQYRFNSPILRMWWYKNVAN
jgi:AAA+ ATPase superfamily predicted ATPase